MSQFAEQTCALFLCVSVGRSSHNSARVSVNSLRSSPVSLLQHKQHGRHVALWRVVEVLWEASKFCAKRNNVFGKVKHFFSCACREGVRGNGGVAPRICSLVPTWRCVVNSTLMYLYRITPPPPPSPGRKSSASCFVTVDCVLCEVHADAKETAEHRVGLYDATDRVRIVS
jgi:hypothetical protein